MSGAWQTFLEKLSEETDSEKSWQTEICDCKDGKNQLFYRSNDKTFFTRGKCDQNNFCAQIMKDKHLTKINSRVYQKKQYSKQKRAERKYSKQITCKLTAKTLRKNSAAKEQDISYKSLTSFFNM